MPDNWFTKSYCQFFSSSARQAKRQKANLEFEILKLQYSRFCTCKYPESLQKEDNTGWDINFSALSCTTVHMTLTFNVTAPAVCHLSLPALTLRFDICWHTRVSPRRWQRHLSACKPSTALGSSNIHCKLVSNTSLIREGFLTACWEVIQCFCRWKKMSQISHTNINGNI